MPHIKVSLYAGKSDAQKQALTDAIVKNVMEIMGNSEGSISVGFEDVQPEDWKAKYDAEIKPVLASLTKKPGYKL
ncbi:4-oxalocrotonate tautomerase [Pustulibacterium marinum]|uniref:4-oxalocrotonate tautomerase n=1 Tax=Pustulibacterium marinum TaxID=1224947 RepID=A0A1I7G1F8_9FLAO|nr:tautomerase family protein [Pustulibacterium marinum]SFU42279.1 4-oxalocrotonate tautomerase [Pustulibacterium marinum]